MKHYELGQCVFHFAAAMYSKLRHKEIQGFQGWNNPGSYLDEGEIQSQIIEQMDKGNWVNVANFAMFAWNRQKKK